MPIRPKAPAVAPETPVVARTRVRPVVAPAGPSIRKVLTSLKIVDVAPGVRGCGSALHNRIPGHPELHIQIALPDGGSLALEVIERETGKLVDTFSNWGKLEAKYGEVLPRMGAKPRKRKRA